MRLAGGTTERDLESRYQPCRPIGLSSRTDTSHHFSPASDGKLGFLFSYLDTVDLSLRRFRLTDHLNYFRLADNPGVDIATSGLSQVDYGAENGAGKRWV